MIDFHYYNPARIVFGKDSMQKLGTMLKKYGATKVLLHYGTGSIKHNGVYDGVIKALRAEKLSYVELGGVRPNPRLSLVMDGIELCKRENVDFILAAGGGSTIDSAKAIAIGLEAGEDFWEEHYMLGAPVKKMCPVGVVLTLSATGSESSTSSVITNEATGFKRGAGGEALIPKFAIMNPEFTYSLPAYQTACGAADILSHLLERYFTPTENVDFTDRLIESAIKTILVNGPRALKESKNYDARAQVMWVGTIAHNNILNTGRIGDWASHRIEHELSGMFDIAHGAGLAIIFPAWMKYVYKKNTRRFVQLAVRVFDVDLGCFDDEAVFEELIIRLQGWFKSLGLPLYLSDTGIILTEEQIKKMAAMCVEKRGTVGEFLPLAAADIEKIYRLAK